MTTTFLLICAAILGSIIGSFINIVIYRLPKILRQQWRQQCLTYLKLAEEKTAPPKHLLTLRPRCRRCHKTITWSDSIPIISYFLSNKKCRYCYAKIPWQYPAIEILTAFLTVLVVLTFGFTWQAVGGIIFTAILIILFMIDLRHKILPDGLTLGLLWLGLLFNINHFFAPLPDAVIGAVAGYCFLWLIGWGFKKIRGLEGLGHGDYKLFAALGAWLGWQWLVLIILISACIGILVGLFLILRKKMQYKTPLPFGPFLITVGWLIFIFSTHLNIGF